MPNQQNYSDKKGMLQAYASKGTSVAVATFIYHLLIAYFICQALFICYLF